MWLLKLEVEDQSSTEASRNELLLRQRYRLAKVSMGPKLYYISLTHSLPNYKAPRTVVNLVRPLLGVADLKRPVKPIEWGDDVCFVLAS